VQTFLCLPLTAVAVSVTVSVTVPGCCGVQVLEEFWSRGMVEVRDMRDTIQYDSYHYSEVRQLSLF